MCMRGFSEDPPLGYQLYRVHNALRAEVTEFFLVVGDGRAWRRTLRAGGWGARHP